MSSADVRELLLQLGSCWVTAWCQHHGAALWCSSCTPGLPHAHLTHLPELTLVWELRLKCK